MGTIGQQCIQTIRQAPLFSAFDAPWGILEQHKLTENSILFPKVDFSIDKIQQTAIRAFFGLTLPTLAKHMAFWNLGMGVAHSVWCIIHIRKFQGNEKGFERDEIEKAFIRMTAGVYDLVLSLLFRFNYPGATLIHVVLPIVIVAWPQAALQLHQCIFNKAVISPSAPAKPSGPAPEQKDKAADNKAPSSSQTGLIDHFHLEEGCLVKQFAKGLTDAILPPPPPPSEPAPGLLSRVRSIPNALRKVSSPNSKRSPSKQS